MTGLTTHIADNAVIHGGRKGKAHRIVANIASGANGNVNRWLTNGNHAIVAGFTTRGEHLKHAAYMTGLAINNIVLTFKRKAGNQVIKGRNVGNNCGGIRRRDENSNNKKQAQ